jgi:hypothetical protein
MADRSCRSPPLAKIAGSDLVPDATNSVSWLIQKKNKRGKCKAAEQDGPVPRIETKKTSIRQT